MSVPIDHRGAAPSPAEPVPPEFDVLCEQCGYSLVGLRSDRCPECGLQFDVNALPLARVPWLYRRRIGYASAYLRTVWMILREPRAFARELCRPVRISISDARAFRRLTIRIALICTWLTAVIAILIFSGATMSGLSAQDVAIIVVLTLTGLVSLWIFLWLASDVPTFVWSGLPSAPQELAPVHHYAIAPLALIVIVDLIVLTSASLHVLLGPASEVFAFVFVPAMPLAPLMVLLLWLTPLLFMSAMGFRWRRVLAFAIYLPIHWAMILALSLLFFAAVPTIIFGSE